MPEMNRLKLKRKSYFVIEAIRMIEEQGIHNLSARTVAERAGFNTSSIYTYFSNMEHLESLACIYFTKKYLTDLDGYFKKAHSWTEKYMIMWELFLKHSFARPNEFAKVFYPISREPWTNQLYNEFFAMFPIEFQFADEQILEYLTIGSVQGGFHRDKYLLAKAASEGSVDRTKIDYIAEINIAYTYSVVSDIVNGVLDPRDRKLYSKCISYIAFTLLPYVTEDYKGFIVDKIKEYETLL